MATNPQTIGIDASRAVGRVRTGTENYSAQLIRALTSMPTDHGWRLYFNGNSDDLELPGALNTELRDIPAAQLWTHIRLSQELLFNRVTGLFVPAHVVPLYHPPTVVTIHDLGYLHLPDDHPASQRRMLDLTTRWSAKAARHIIVPSEQTASDLTHFYNTFPDKISVVHHGIDPSISRNPDHTDASLRSTYILDRPYVLAVGTIQPRKNLGILAKAMAVIIQRHDVDLVIAGRKGWMYESVESELIEAGLGHRLRILDYVPAADLPALYRGAEIFVQPSRFEGFGMPVLEAMASGTAVIAAAGSSLDEIGGNATYRFEHDDSAALIQAIESLLDHPQERAKLIQTGLDHSSRFTWEQTAHKTRIILEEALLN